MNMVTCMRKSCSSYPCSQMQRQIEGNYLSKRENAICLQTCHQEMFDREIHQMKDEPEQGGKSSCLGRCAQQSSACHSQTGQDMCRGSRRFVAYTFPSTCGKQPSGESGESKQGPVDSGSSRKSRNIDLCRRVKRKLGPECIQDGFLDLLRVSLAALAVRKSRPTKGQDLRKEH